MTDPNDRNIPRTVRQSMPMALDVIEEVAKQHGICIRPIPLKRADTETGKTEIVNIPCGATLESKCEPCAKRAVQLRKAQCREGWHLEAEPIAEPTEPTERQLWLIEERADAHVLRELAEETGGDTTVWDEVITTLEDELATSGVRGSVVPGEGKPRRSRSTRRRQDAPDLPKRQRENRTRPSARGPVISGRNTTSSSPPNAAGRWSGARTTRCGSRSSRRPASVTLGFTTRGTPRGRSS